MCWCIGFVSIISSPLNLPQVGSVVAHGEQVRGPGMTTTTAAVVVVVIVARGRRGVAGVHAQHLHGVIHHGLVKKQQQQQQQQQLVN